METNEILESINTILKNRHIVFKTKPSDNKKSLKNFKELEDYIGLVIKTWEQFNLYTQNPEQKLKTIYNHFNLINNKIRELKDASDLNRQKYLIDEIENMFNQSDWYNIHPFSKTGKALQTLHRHSKEAAAAMADYLESNGDTFSQSYISNSNYMFGIIQTLDYFLKKEKVPISEIENYHQSDIISSYSNELSKLFESYNTDNASLLTVRDETVVETKEAIAAFSEESESMIKAKSDKFNDLEKTYNEKLKLEKPANYWAQMAKEYQKSGVIWSVVTTFLAICFVGALTYAITKIPELYDGANQQLLDLSSLRITLFFAVIASILVFVIRLFVRITLSSFHLSRDAKEREQLAYFFLALQNDNAIDPSERTIVLNSLFSRADTGLVKGESGPTMPESMLQQITKAAK